MDAFSLAVQKIGQRIRQLRSERGLTQRELAEKAGVFDIGELERGRKVKGGPVNPTAETLHKVAVALGVELEDLLGRPAPDEFAARIGRMLEGRSVDVRERALKVVEALVG